MGAWPILDGSSKEALDSEAECKVVLTVFWQRKEKVKSYQEFLKLRGWKDGSLVWLQKRIAPYPITAPTAAAVGWGNAYGWTTGTVWGTDGVWGNGHGWGHNDGWSDTTSDDGPPWDGVTMVPKTRGKKRPFFWTVARLARKQQAGKFTVPDNAAEPRGAFPAAPLSERHGLVPFFLGFFCGFPQDVCENIYTAFQEEKRTNKRLPVLAIGSEASEVTLLVISTSLVGGGRHIDCDWNDAMDILSVDILSGERLSLSQIDAGFIGPNEVTFGGKLGPVGSVRVSGSS
ncbi:hypothetical protein DFH08DRAFT_821491 [Mycena albidolilacea]|uniref:Uncharacterized protein n=1 Tax=Mycena albidolilacea TaxID=1033008 RepID=A0AAD6ZAC9_9AGAR|nr:hypothetical protein DFH08DRAFT_821491 [Mycena albidolilacea]